MRTTLGAVLAAVFALFVLAGSSEAQFAALDVGVTGGVNFANVSGDDDEGSKNLTGFMAGVSFIYPVSSMFAFQPEIAYSMKGTKFEEVGESIKIKFAYIDIPLLAKISLGTAMTTARPALYVGPYAAINVGCDIDAAGESFDCDDPLIELEPKSVDFGLIGGVGVDVGPLNVFARYQLGLTNITDDEGDAKHRVIQIGGRFSFRGLR